eukprot:6176203-Pleurochrysis_carterae.AAC.2
MRAPSLIVFDLDAACWMPEMYLRACCQLWGGGAPFKQLSTSPNNRLEDCRGTAVRLLADVAASFAEIHERQTSGEPIMAAVASRSDEPAWARECLRKFVVAPGISMMDVVTEDRCEIYKGSKKAHFAVSFLPRPYVGAGLIDVSGKCAVAYERRSALLERLIRYWPLLYVSHS